MTIPVYTIVIAAICFIAMVAFLIFAKRQQKFKLVGTMHIDMNREDKDICLFTLDIPLESISKEQYVLLKVDGKSGLKEWIK